MAHFGRFLAVRGSTSLDDMLGRDTVRATVVEWVEWIYVDSPAYWGLAWIGAIPLLLAILTKRPLLAAVSSLLVLVVSTACFMLVPIAFWIYCDNLLEQMYEGALEMGIISPLEDKK